MKSVGAPRKRAQPTVSSKSDRSAGFWSHSRPIPAKKAAMQTKMRPRAPRTRRTTTRTRRRLRRLPPPPPPPPPLKPPPPPLLEDSGATWEEKPELKSLPEGGVAESPPRVVARSRRPASSRARAPGSGPTRSSARRCRRRRRRSRIRFQSSSVAGGSSLRLGKSSVQRSNAFHLAARSPYSGASRFSRRLASR